MSIPIGHLRSELGRQTRPGLIPIVPCSFVISEDGRIAILDPAKHRLALFAVTGKFADQMSPVSEVANDLAETATGWLVVDDESRGNLRLLSQSTTRIIHERETVPDGSLDAPFLFAFSDTSTSVWTSSGLHPIGTDAHIDYKRSGVPADGGYLTVHAAAANKFRFVLPTSKALTITAVSPQPHYLPIMTIDTLYWRRDGLRLFLRVGDLNGSDSPLTGLYYLRITRNGRILDSEHLAAPDIKQENVKRRGFVDVSGRVWQMAVASDHVELRREPSHERRPMRAQ